MKIVFRLIPGLLAAVLLAVTPMSIGNAAPDDLQLNPDFSATGTAPWRTRVGPGDTLITMNPVNLDAGTKISWNGKDISTFAVMAGDCLEPQGTYFSFYGCPYILNGGEKLPNDGFGVSPLNPETMTNEDEYTTETKIAFLWTTIGSTIYPTFALDEKTVSSVAFTGLPDDALVSAAPDGICLNFKNPGEYTVTYTVTDSAGLTRKFPAKCTFEILPAK